MDTMERFWNKVEKTDSCWIWKGSKEKASGYGLFKLNKKRVRAHRVAYWLTHGQWSVITRHTCDNPICVNPGHLLSGTTAENNMDIRLRNRRKNCLTNEQVKEIRAMVYDDTVVSRVVEIFGVSPQVARSVLNGKMYAHVSGGRAVPRQKSHRILTEQEVNEIRLALQNIYWGQQIELAHRYGVSRNVIQRIQYGTY